MSPRNPSRRFPLAKRRELEIAAAVAREAVTRHHVQSALRLVALGAESVSAIRMLQVYLRLHGLVGAHGEQLAYSVLAALGTRTTEGDPAGLFLHDAEDASDSGSLWRVLRYRLRGRRHQDLRRRVELATGAARARLVAIHVQHAIRFADDLAATHSVAEAAAVYGDMAGVPQPLRDAFAILLTERLASRDLPPAGETAREEDRVALYPRAAVRSKRAG